MAEFNRNVLKKIRQGLGDGSCRNRENDASAEATAPGTCRGGGLRRGRGGNMVPAESVADFERKFQNSELELLKAQAERMQKALENIQEQIRAISEE